MRTNSRPSHDNLSHAEKVRDISRRARPQTERRREATRSHSAHHAQEPVHIRVRRGDEQLGQHHRAQHHELAQEAHGRPDVHLHRSSSHQRHRCRRDFRSREWQGRRERISRAAHSKAR